MLKHLLVKNYALIDELDLELDEGFSVITGETGAGKSIILGALGLVLGNRADLKSLRDPESKCVVEGTFLVRKEELKEFFKENELDFEEETIIRREILPSGKSRAFINDTPVNLSVISEMAERLIDVHSQHQNLLLSDNAFQLELLDSFAGNHRELNRYSEAFLFRNSLIEKIDNLKQDIGNKDIDTSYLEFLLKELNDTQLKEGEQETLENELQVLEHAEEIQSQLAKVRALIEDEISESGIRQNLLIITSSLNQLARFDEKYAVMAGRAESMRIEMDDLLQEVETNSTDVESDPETLEKLDARLSTIIRLQKKHGVDSVAGLLVKRDELTDKVDRIIHGEEKLRSLQAELEKAMEVLHSRSLELHETRAKTAPLIEKKISGVLAELNMAAAEFTIDVVHTDRYTSGGADKITYAFSANKGQAKQPLSKVASGGEMSRVMLAFKAVMAGQNQLPSIIFDEIDTGVSGETAGKIGRILKAMGHTMQVIAISHLPQIASLAGSHFKVLKEIKGGQTFTRIVKLEEEDRLHELARLLSGEEITDAALANARNLLKVS